MVLTIPSRNLTPIPSALLQTDKRTSPKYYEMLWILTFYLFFLILYSFSFKFLFIFLFSDDEEACDITVT